MIRFTCAKKGEKAQTVRTLQFPHLVFHKDTRYILMIAGFYVPAYVNRDEETLYIKAKDWPESLERATVGNARHYEVSLIYKEMKTGV